MFKRKDGRYVEKLSFRGKVLYIYGKTPDEVRAKVKLYAAEDRLANTFKEVAQLWWEETESTLSQQSIPSYKKSMEDAIDFFEYTPMETITPAGVLAYLKLLARKKLAYKTVAKRRLVLNLICRFAVINNVIQSNPCADVYVPKGLSQEKRPPASYRDEDIVRDTEGIWIFYSLVLLAGLRKGEALALRPKDVDFENNLIFVRASVAFDTAGNGYIKKPKTEAGTRTVPLLPKLKKRLEGQMPLSSLAYFCNRSREPMTKKAFVAKENAVKRQYGITSTPHQFRHSFATICFERGISPKATQAMIGHKNVSTTLDIYTEARARRLAQEADVLSDL